MRNVHIYRDADNPSSMLIWSDIDDPAKARAVLDSPELRKTMTHHGQGDGRAAHPAFEFEIW